jgi:hypothetical protein
MAALEGRIGRSIYESVRGAPIPDRKKLDEQSRVLEEKIVEALGQDKPWGRRAIYNELVLPLARRQALRLRADGPKGW